MLPMLESEVTRTAGSRVRGTAKADNTSYVKSPQDRGGGTDAGRPILPTPSPEVSEDAYSITMAAIADGLKDHDVFICHAWEDKSSFARPMADALRRRGLRVWYDEFSIQWGDSLRQKIDRGVATSRYGLVALSSAFFAKRWTQYELDGLLGRELATGSTVILPIWHGLEHRDVAQYSASLAERSALKSSLGVEAIATEVRARLIRELQAGFGSDALLRRLIQLARDDQVANRRSSFYTRSTCREAGEG